LALGIEALHRLRQQVRGRVADDLQPLRILRGDDADLGVVLDQVAGVAQPAVDLAGQRGLGQARADVGRDVHHRYGLVVLSLAAVRQRDRRHDRFPSF
jgi:hypothetical protein